MLPAPLIVSAYFLVLPAIRWLREQTTAAALGFFNKACFYPLAIFAVLTASIPALSSPAGSFGRRVSHRPPGSCPGGSTLSWS